MTNLIETKICEISDHDFQILIAELCKCFDWPKTEFKNKTLANLFTSVVTEKKKMNLNMVSVDRILAMKVKDLALGSAVHDACREFISRNGKSMDDFTGKTVFTVIKQCYKVVCPSLRRIKNPTRKESAYQLQIDLIKRGRVSGTY